MERNLSKIFKKDRSMILAYDQGLEHGPKIDFNLRNCDPKFIFEIAEKGGFDALIVEPGIAEKYYSEYRGKFPIIVKLTGRTSLNKTEPYSAMICSVKRAADMGATAVGFVFYPGSSREADMMENLAKVVEEAHDYGMPVVLWSYPRGSFITDDSTTDLMAYAARIGLELGTDVVKLRYNGDIDGLKWTLANSGKQKVVVAGGNKTDTREFLTMVKKALDAGASGVAVGRNVWKNEQPIKLSHALHKIVHKEESVDKVMKDF